VTSLSHDEARERFDRYYEGDLDSAERDAVDAHLAACPACQQEYQQLVAAMNALASMRGQAAPKDFVDAVQGRIRKRSRGRFFARRQDFTTRLPYELLSVVMLIAILAIFLYIFLGKGGGAIAR
jgi:anti-sigma factor RsiW